MGPSIFTNHDSYSYEALNHYFQNMVEAPREIDPILSYVRHLILEQPDLNKFHALEVTLGQKVRQIGADTPLATLANQVNAIMHQEMPKSLVAQSHNDPQSILAALKEESDSVLIFDTLSELALNCPEDVATHLTLFKHLTLSQQHALAHSCALTAPEWTLGKLNLFNVRSDEDKVKIAKKVVESNPDNLEFLQKLELSEESLKNLALHFAQTCPLALIEHYNSLEILDSQFVADQAVVFAKKYPEQTLQFYHRFGLNRQRRVALIGECIRNSGNRVELVDQLVCRIAEAETLLLTVIQQEKDQEILQLLAFACAKQVPRFLAEHIQDFMINDQKILELLAREVAIQSGAVLCESIQDFGIEDPAVRFELAKQVSASIDFWEVQDIVSFDIFDESDRLELAIRYFNKLDPRLHPQIKVILEALEIQNPQNLLKLAKTCIKVFPVETAAEIDCFGIEDQEELIAIARESILRSEGKSIEHLPLFKIEDPLRRIELAECAAERNGGSTARCIGQLGITDSGALLKIATLCAENDGLTVEYLDSFSHERGIQRQQLALLCAKTAPEAVIKHFDSLGIDDELGRFELALACAKSNPSSVAKKIEIFQLEEKHREIVAELCIGADLFKNLKKFRITNPIIRIGLATTGMKTCPMDVAIDIKEFEIENKDLEFEILRHCLLNSTFSIDVLKVALSHLSESKKEELALFYFSFHPNRLIEHLGQLEIDQSLKLKLLMQYSDLPGGTVPNIKAAGIEDPDKRMMLALRYATRYPSQFAAGVDSFDIPDESQRFELAALCFKGAPASIPKHIQKFELNEDHFLSLAYECAKEPKSKLLTYLRKMGLDKRKEILQIALLCAQYNGAETVNLLSLKFRELDQASLLKVIQACAVSVPDHIHKIINPKNIPSERDRIEMAKIAIRASAHSLSYFDRFGIDNQTACQELITLYQECFPEEFKTECIYLINPKYIESEQERIRLLKNSFIAKAQEAMNLIDQFAIQDHEILINFLKESFIKKEINDVGKLFLFPWTKEEERMLNRMLRLTQPGLSLEEESDQYFFDCYQVLMDQANRLEKISQIQKIYPKIHALLSQYPEMVEQDKLPKVGEVLSFAQVKKIALAFIGLSILPKEKLITPLIENKQLEGAIIKMVTEGANSPSVLQIVQSHYPMIREFLSQYPTIIKIDQLPGAEESLSLAQMKTCCASYLGLKLLLKDKLAEEPIDSKALEIGVIKEKLEVLNLVKDLFQKIVNHRNPSQAISYLRLLAYQGSAEMIEGLRIATQTALKEGSKEQYGKPLAPLLIPMLVVAKWGADCHQPKLVRELNQFFRVSKIREHYFKKEFDRSDSMAQVWLKTVDLLDSVQELSPERKILLLTEAAQPIEKLRDRLLLIQGVVCSGGGKKLDRDFGPSMEEDLRKVIADGLASDPYLNLGGVEDLMNKYMETLATLRFPNGWKIYERGLEQTNEIEVQQAYRRFIVGVLNGTFRKERYETTSPHIELIQKGHEAIWRKWQPRDLGRKISLGGIDYLIQNTDNWQDLLLSGTEVAGSCQAISDSSTLNKALLAYLLDGKNRMIAIKDPDTGQICARALFRLMWDQATQSPVLFLDKKYPMQLSEEMAAALDQYAIEQAQKIGCPLYSSQSLQHDLPMNIEIVSKGSCAPYEYADSADVSNAALSLIKQGVYAIRKGYQLVN